MNDTFCHRAIILTFCAVMLIVFGSVMVKGFQGNVSDEAIRQTGQDFNMVLVALTGYLGGLAAKKGP